MVLKLTKERVNNINSALIILALYMDILLYPLINLIGSSIVLWISLGIIILISIRINKSISLKYILIVTGFITFFIINYLSVDYKDLVKIEFFNFFRTGILIFYLSSQITDYKSLIKWWYRIAIISFIVCNLLLNYFIKNNLYMDFGIFMTYNFIVFCTYLYKKFNKKLILNISLIGICLIEILIFANRGSLLICIFTIAYYEILNLKKSRPYITILKIICIGMGSTFIFKNINQILNNFINFLSSIGVSSYSLNKMVLSLHYGLIKESSGRDTVLKLVLDISGENSYMPRGVRYLDYLTNGKYPYTHNLFTDILLTFGVIGLVLFLIFIIYITYKIYLYSSVNEEFKYVSSGIYIYLIIRLTLSSTFWKESLFWMLIGMVIFCRVRYTQIDNKLYSRKRKVNI